MGLGLFYEYSCMHRLDPLTAFSNLYTLWSRGILALAIRFYTVDLITSIPIVFISVMELLFLFGVCFTTYLSLPVSLFGVYVRQIWLPRCLEELFNSSVALAILRSVYLRRWLYFSGFSFWGMTCSWPLLLPSCVWNASGQDMVCVKLFWLFFKMTSISWQFIVLSKCYVQSVVT